MNVQPYTRHSQTCPKRADRYWKRCKCPKWLWTSGDGKQSRISARTRSWERAEQLARKRMSGTSVAREDGRPRIADAAAQYLREKESHNITHRYVEHLESLLQRQFVPWCKQEALVYLDQVTLSQLERYRQTWTAKNSGRHPVALLSPVNVKSGQAGYFTPDEMQRILDACPLLYPHKGYHEDSAEFLTQKMRAFVLLLRWSGLRIGDATTLARARLSDDDKLLLHTAKTGAHVFVPLPPHVAAEIRALPGEYFFWSGTAQVDGTTKNWRAKLKALFRIANVKGHPHMLRDTFAVELLQRGVSVEIVAMLLGHSSVKTTERHYSPWVAARQKQLEDSVRKAWATA